MSKHSLYPDPIPSELIERYMRRARLERSRAVWAMLQQLFSRPESSEAEDTNFSLKQPKLRLG
jgi:hypothetical protein